jgi:polyferredoxin
MGVQRSIADHNLAAGEIYQPRTPLDILHMPLLGRLLRWRWGRLVFQVFFFAVAALVIYDGLTGPQLAPENSATVLAWVHYRGFVILALLLVGNLFCFACPFTLPRTLARRLSLAGGRWPRALRNKWVSIGGLFVIFWLYEWLDLWASPWLTAWVAVAYFLGSFILEAAFSESPFCKYVCPLGAFNFVYATASPLQIRPLQASVCHSCAGKECVNGSGRIPGCGTELFVPTVQSNMDCTFCLDCARACPYDNVALSPRQPLNELVHDRWLSRWDLAFLVVALTFFGISNAFGMVSPVYAVHNWMARSLGIESDGVRLLIIFGILNLGVPALVVFGGAWLSTALGQRTGQSPLQLASRYAPAFVPMGFGIWLAHYGFHFSIAGLTIVPVMQSFLLDHGLNWLGSQPAWGLSRVLPQEWIFPLQVTAVLAGFFVGLYVLSRRALRPGTPPMTAFRELLPWAIVLLLVTAACLSIFNLPMEMRGTFNIGVR